MSRLFNLDGKVVLLTGATGHLGQAMSKGLAEAGATLAVVSSSKHKAEALAKQLRVYTKAKPFQANLEHSNDILMLIEEVAKAFGRIDCVINNAYFGAANSFENMSLEQWQMGLQGAATTPMLMMQQVLPYLEETKGSIINIASMYGMVSPNPELYIGNQFANPINYGAGKAALLQMTRYAAVHLAKKNIRVNAISPGPFPSEKVKEDKIFIDRLNSKVPMGRIGNPDELKGAVIFLASDASSYITGHNLIVDGGWTIW